MRWSLVTFLPFCLLGCPVETPTDITSRAPSLEGEEPGPGDMPPPNGAGPQEVNAAKFVLDPENSIDISGILDYPGQKEGKLLVEVLTVTDGTPELKHSEVFEKAGDFTIGMPKALGSVQLVAFVDVDGDGPSEHDPAGMLPIEVQDAPVSGLVLTLSDNADLGNLTPGKGAEQPPPATDQEIARDRAFLEHRDADKVPKGPENPTAPEGGDAENAPENAPQGPAPDGTMPEGSVPVPPPAEGAPPEQGD
ncbi:MAG: hypothetical protein VX519_05425 [Myxococcota bacterium]|nr:hypothetical protein [Myxococcota bacterium]